MNIRKLREKAGPVYREEESSNPSLDDDELMNAAFSDEESQEEPAAKSGVLDTKQINAANGS
jgi:hypothetical protein